MKWVEVGVPSKEGLPKGYDVVLDKDSSGSAWKIIKDGKPLKNIDEYPYNDVTKTPNEFSSREEAASYARRIVADEALRNEGDVMGHCVGGYCEYVHSGESKIYSLRDEKGMSHVTVEVQPEGKGFEGGGSGTLADPANVHPNIIQIKGKQNRAPVDKYLPYVQDFVKSGKWGYVGDLENAGLIEVGRQDKGPAYLRQEKILLDDLFPGERFLTAEQNDLLKKEVFVRLNAGAPEGQQGKIDPKLLARIGAASAVGGASYYFSDKDKLAHAALGAIAGGLGISLPFG